ncbi:curli production assembly protein CsgE [Vibrio mediterranei]|uniref:Curli production assembly/transport component CsgE n=2 Tax=Vibrionaceae TaxID=641 RepID=A0A3G4VJW2_9VIBR|nr:curli production assembly protein CsgE [Vibrio mediterranei]NUW74682.1 curli production assembly protein CsgE [Vibrio mediterranei]
MGANMKLLLLMSTVCLFASSVLGAGTNNGIENGAPLENGKKIEGQGDKLKVPFNDFSEVSGVIVDRTITRLGEDFYFFFSQQLNDRYPDLKENLTIKEIPTALSGSIIEVYHSRKAIYRTALSPGRRQAKDRANDALQVVGNYIIRWQAERLYMDTFDLEHDEF